ncbi:MAG: hypothetical protein BGO98_21645 [Myxococcales bacterium 68-20]|nr:MAG: hypothetical protein BGO98_21645 [Myxococcales bacterium 68-20]
MRRLWTPAAIAITIATVAAGTACGADGESAFGDGTNVDAGDFDGGLGAPTSDAGSVGSASGVVIVHAASFPAFRLCFENYPDLPPQPDRTVMPQANVVGVEMGSVVRIGPLDRRPGKVFVVAQRKVAATPTESAAKSCGELLDPVQGELTRDLEYHEAGELTSPLGVDSVSMLAIAGCGGGAYLQALGVPQAECGAGYDATHGSLHARTLTLLPSIPATEQSLPVQIIHLSTMLEANRGDGEDVEVTFGPLDGGAYALEQPVASNPPLFDASAPVTLTLDQSIEATYGTHGFRIALRSSGDAGASFTVDQSLAEVQQLSAPQTVPTDYYLAASNYALLLLGDPRIARTYADGGANPGYDRRRAVHLLAVPVKDDVEDAGTPSVDDAGPTGP